MYSRMVAFVGIAFVLALTGCAGTEWPQDVEGWRAFFDSPGVMAVCMLAGLLVYGLQQTKTLTHDKTMTLFDYFSYGREALIGLVTCFASFVGAYLAGQMTAVGAFALGIAGGLLSDTGKGGRALDQARMIVADAKKNPTD